VEICDPRVLSATAIAAAADADYHDYNYVLINFRTKLNKI